VALDNGKIRALLAGWAVISLLVAPAQGAELKPETVAAFNRYIGATEARMDEDLRASHFLVMDRLPDARREEAYARLRKGQIYIERLRALEDGRQIHIPSGMIHHWVGVIFIPGATFSQVLAVIQDYDNHQNIYKPDVRRSKLLERSGNEGKIYLQFYNKSIVTAVFNANFIVYSIQFGSARALKRSYSTRIAEVENIGKPDERELPVGKDHGYMWRLYNYWRVEEKDGGVYLEVEAVTLSRTVPPLLAWLVNPLIRNIPKKVLTNLLNATRRAVKNQNRPTSAFVTSARNGSLMAVHITPVLEEFHPRTALGRR